MLAIGLLYSLGDVVEHLLLRTLSVERKQAAVKVLLQHGGVF